MAEARPFPFTACIDHSNLTLSDFMTLEAPDRNFEPEKYASIYRFVTSSPGILEPKKYSLASREFATVSETTCSFKSEKSLEERQADIARIREEHPDKIPVIIQHDKGSRIRYPKKKLLIPAKSNLKDFFLWMWKNLYESESYSLISVVEHKDPIFEKPMSPVYEEYKDEDGCLYITVSGEKKDYTEPIPSNIKTYTVCKRKAFVIVKLSFSGCLDDVI